MSAYIILGEYIIASTSLLATFISFTGLIILSKRKHDNFKFSSAMLLYMFCCACLGFFSFFHLIYLTIFWKFNSADLSYNSYYLWFTGVLQSIFLLSMPLCILFLCIIRCLIIRFPIKFTDRHQLNSTKCMCAILIILNSSIIYLDYIPDFPKNSITNCRAFGCMTPTTKSLIYLNLRYCIAAINVLMAFILPIIIKKYLNGNNNNSNNNSKSNKTVLFTILIAIIFDFIPHFSALIGSEFFNLQMTAIVGPYSVFVGSLDAGVCAMLYLKTYGKMLFPTKKITINASTKIQSAPNLQQSCINKKREKT